MITFSARASGVTRLISISVILFLALGYGNSALAQSVVINEIMQNPSAVSDSNGEWFEVYNPTASAVDINGWTIKDDDFDSHVINNGGPLNVPAGGFLVLGNNADSATNGGVTVDYEYASNFFLSNSSDELVLLDGSDTEIDRVEWDNGATFPDPNGASMSLGNPTLDNNVGGNWCTASTTFGAGDKGTPGAGNDCSAAPLSVFIHQVQGSGSSVAITSLVQVEAVVTSLFEENDVVEAFFIQEEDTDADSDPNTSEGIFVFCDTGCGAVSVNQIVRVTGIPGEFFGMSQIDTTGSKGKIEVLGGAGAGKVSATSVSLPAPASTTEELTFEKLEGMLVQFSDKLVVSEYFQLARFGQVVLTKDDRPVQYTQDNLPSIAGNDAFEADLATRRIILDDVDNDQNEAIFGPAADEPYFYPDGGLSTSNFFRGGDSFTGLTGVLHWSWAGSGGTDAWRVRPVPGGVYTPSPDNLRDDTPATVGGDITVASFNVLNFFTTLDTGPSICGPSGTLGCRGANSAAELQRQTDKIVAALAAVDADIVGLIEIENNDTASLTALVNALNAVGDKYEFIDTGSIGGDAIKVAIIYKNKVVKPKRDFAILDSSVDPSFIDTKNRPVLAQTFKRKGAGDERFTVAVAHLKSKGSSCDDVSDPNLGDGQGNCNGTRTLATQAIADWLASDPTNSKDPDFLIIGDLNAYAMEDPVTTLEAAGYSNLVKTYEGTDAYSYVFDGRVGYLDHALANSSLVPQVTGITTWHINADEINVLDYNDEIRDPGEASFERESAALPLFDPNAFRSSDHDPIIIGLDLDNDSRDDD